MSSQINIPLLPEATFKPSIHPDFGLPRTRPLLLPTTPSSHTFNIIDIFSPLVQTISILRTSSFLTLSIRDTPTKLLKHFISKTFTFLLSALLIINASAPYNAVGTNTPSHRHFSFIPILYCSAHFSALPTLITHSFCVSHLFPILHPLTPETPGTSNSPLL